MLSLKEYGSSSALPCHVRTRSGFPACISQRHFPRYCEPSLRQKAHRCPPRPDASASIQNRSEEDRASAASGWHSLQSPSSWKASARYGTASHTSGGILYCTWHALCVDARQRDDKTMSSTTIADVRGGCHVQSGPPRAADAHLEDAAAERRLCHAPPAAPRCSAH